MGLFQVDQLFKGFRQKHFMKFKYYIILFLPIFFLPTFLLFGPKNNIAVDSPDINIQKPIPAPKNVLNKSSRIKSDQLDQMKSSREKTQIL